MNVFSYAFCTILAVKRRFAHYIATSRKPHSNQYPNLYSNPYPNPNPKQYPKPCPNPNTITYALIKCCRNIVREPKKAGCLNMKTKMASKYSHRVFTSQPIRTRALKVVCMLRWPAFLTASIIHRLYVIPISNLSYCKMDFILFRMELFLYLYEPYPIPTWILSYNHMDIIL